LTDLQGNTLYHFRVSCVGSDSSSGATGDNRFRTLGEEVDTTPPANVTNLYAVSSDSQVALYWQNPPDDDFAGVVIRRSTSYYPSRTQGVLIYDGNGASFLDSGLTNDTLYYYSVFSYDFSGNYASGVGVSGLPHKGKPTTTTPPITPPITPPGVVTPQDLFFRDFIFEQLGKSLPIDSSDQVGASTGYGLTVVLPDAKVITETAKMVLNLGLDGQISSYIFDHDATKQAYVANLPAIANAGRDAVTIVVLDVSDRTLKVVSGWIVFSQPEVKVLPSLPEEITATIYTPLSDLAQTPAGKTVAAASVAIGVVAVVVGTPWWNFWILLQLFFTQPLRFIWFRRGWGTVYNSITKRPVDLALVRLYRTSDNKLMASRVTDKNGRYIFLVDPGEYYLKVEKAGFEFPSALLKHARDDGNFVDLYYGEKIAISGTDRAAIIANIPFDQGDVKMSDQQILHQFSHTRFARRLSWLGPVLAVIYFILYPSLLAGLVVALHLLILWLFSRLGERRHKKSWGVVFDKNRRNPIGKAITRVFSSEYGRMLEFYVTDNQGRYGFLVGDNKYYVTADKPGYSTAQTPPIDLTGQKLEKMVIAQDLPLTKLEQAETPITPIEPSQSSVPTVASTTPSAVEPVSAPSQPAPSTGNNIPPTVSFPKVESQINIPPAVPAEAIPPSTIKREEIKEKIQKDMIKPEKEIKNPQVGEIKNNEDQKTPIELLVESRMQKLREKKAVEPAIQPEVQPEVKSAEPQPAAEVSQPEVKEESTGAKNVNPQENIFG